MSRSLRQLLRRLLARQTSRTAAAARAGQLPAEPTVGQLREAVHDAQAERSAGAQQLALLLMAADRSASEEVLASAAQLLQSAAPSLWLSLDVVARRNWWTAPPWADAALGRLSHDRPSIVALVVASFHPSGYVREAAVARLAEIDDQLALPALALRAADWVPQVRNRARLALEQRLSSPSADVLLNVGPLAVALRERGHGSWLLGHFQAALHVVSDDVLAPLLATSEWQVRRAAYEAALADNRLSLAALVAAALHDTDLVIRVRCAEAAVRASVATGRADAVQPLTSSKTAAVRAGAVQALASAGQLEAASRVLIDRHPAVRAVAQAAVRRAGSDPANGYRQHLRTAAPPNPGAIAGLGETGTGQDVELVRRSLAHPLPRGRAEAVRALRRLDAATPDSIGALLEDPSGAVTRQVAAALRPVAAGLDVHHLRTLLDAAQPPHVRHAAYRLLREHDVWTRLCTDLELINDPQLALRTRARTDLGTWVQLEAATTYSMPKGETAERLDQLLLAAENVLPAYRIRLLRFHMGLGRH